MSKLKDFFRFSMLQYNAPTGDDERVPVYSWYVSILVMSSLRRKESDFKLDL